MVELAALVEVDGIKSLPQRLIRVVFRPPAASPPACGAVIRTWVRGLNALGVALCAGVLRRWWCPGPWHPTVGCMATHGTTRAPSALQASTDDVICCSCSSSSLDFLRALRTSPWASVVPLRTSPAPPSSASISNSKADFSGGAAASAAGGSSDMLKSGGRFWVRPDSALLGHEAALKFTANG